MKWNSSTLSEAVDVVCQVGGAAGVIVGVGWLTGSAAITLIVGSAVLLGVGLLLAASRS